jgi:hypothetical protein
MPVVNYRPTTPMRKPIFVHQLVLSIALLSCTKAEFVKVLDADAPGAGGGSQADVAAPPDTTPPDTTPLDTTPPDTTPTLQCEETAKTVCVQPAPNTTISMSCPALCHTMPVQATGPGVVCHSGTGSDNCDKGNVCLPTRSGASTSICFKLCTQAKDCENGVACAARFLSAATWIKVCDLNYDSCSTGNCCDPLAPDHGICGIDMVCYLVAPLNSTSMDSRTVCDYASGDGTAGAACVSSHECVPGFACYFPPTSPETGNCRQVCNPKDPNACPNCPPYNNQYGVCL